MGNNPGAADLHNSGYDTNLSAGLSGLPADGRTLYVRLWFRTNSQGWQFTDVQYSAAGF